MLTSTHYDEEHSLLVLQFDGVFVGAEGQQAFVEFVRSRKILPNNVLLDCRTVTSADMMDSDTALLTHNFLIGFPLSWRMQVTEVVC